MKLLKLVLLFALCFAALGQRSIGFQIDAIGIAKQKDLAPYLKVSIEDSIYIVALESLYEVYLDNSTNQWMKDFTTETHFESLKWNETISLLNGTFELLGAPCPCNNTQEGEEGVEPFNITTRGRQQLRDVLEDIKCQVPPFDFVMLGMQYIANNESSCESVDISLCNNQCTQACQNNSNPENCALGCGAITNGTIIDTIDCNTTCNQAGANGTADADCMFACMNTASCIAGNASCRLDLQYQLNSFQWSNSSGGSPRKLAFAFQIVPEPDEGEECGTEFVTWLEGPFFLWIDTTTLALDLPNLMDLSNVDLSSAVEVPSSVSFAPGASSVTGRLYIDPFTTGHSIFNNRQVGTH